MKKQKMSRVTGLLGLALVGGSVALMTPMTTRAQAAPYYQSGYNNSPSVMLDGRPLNTAVPPIVENGSTLVPMRDIFEALGATVVWDQQDQSIRAQKGSTAIWLQIGSNNARVGNRQVWLNQPPILSMGSTLVPLRFVSEALGANVDWDGNTRVVRITTEENATQAEPIPPQETNNEDSDVDYQDFYENLSPYGQWLHDPEYGYVWQPRVDHNFRPYYTGGHWAMTQYGNTWVSDYPWGWAAFHYGRWDLSDNNGWIWIPGQQWAPAWVSWRSGGGYYGWAPLGPSFNLSISIGNYRAPNNWYAFVPQGHLYDHGYSHYSYNNYSANKRYGVSNQIVNLIQKTTIIHNTSVHNHNTYITGPRVNEVEAVTHQKVRVYNINNSGRAGSSKIQNNSISIYRPAITNHANGKNGSPVAPKNVVKLNRSIVTKSKTGEVNRNGAGNSAKIKNSPVHNNHTTTAPHVNAPRKTGTIPGNKGRSVKPENARKENIPAHNNHTTTAPRVIAPRKATPNSQNNGRKVNPNNARKQNVPGRNDRTNPTPRVNTPRNPAPNPGRNANDNNGRNKNVTQPQTRNNQTKGSTASPTNPKDHNKNNPNQPNGRTNNQQ